MSAQEKKHRGRKVLAVIVLALLVLLSGLNLKIVKDPVWKFIQRDLSFENFADEVQRGYISDSFAHKNDFVNLNGLFARLTGRRTLNGVVKLNNGMLSTAYKYMDMTAMANGITGFSNYLSEQDIPFLYVQIPSKESLDGTSFPTGVVSYAYTNADHLLSQLSERGVETLDLRLPLSGTQEMLEQYFYKTDHHWSSDGAFKAFQEILNYLHELFPEDNIDLAYAQADQWERHSIDDWQLGYWGKRVGRFFGGTDSLIWHTPKFETEMSFAVPARGAFLRGDFSEANIRTQYIEGKNYFGYEAYNVYIGGQYPLVQHRNLYAPSPLKVLMIVDSFSRPLQAYFSTIFQEVDAIDPRSSSEYTIAEYVERTKPDMVIFSLTPGMFDNRAYGNFGEQEVRTISAEEDFCEIVVQQDIEIQASDNRYNYVSFSLDADTVYRVSFEGVDILEGQTDGVGLQFYDRTTGTVLENAIFDLAYCEATNGFRWIFRTPDAQEDQLELLFYAGIYGSTVGNSVIYRDMTIERWHGDAS